MGLKTSSIGSILSSAGTKLLSGSLELPQEVPREVTWLRGRHFQNWALGQNWALNCIIALLRVTWGCIRTTPGCSGWSSGSFGNSWNLAFPRESAAADFGTILFISDLGFTGLYWALSFKLGFQGLVYRLHLDHFLTTNHFLEALNFYKKRPGKLRYRDIARSPLPKLGSELKVELCLGLCSTLGNSGAY